ncbi:DMT family transporter [Nesterenkonia massiliensis]|uniref:DMT family transporter n=1 Tax=Nesterenkonia massiliensis TaxID=1232429 RepID=UPI0004033B5F|nr:DMT family transporter [Nesterenkonia massiliensis]
MTVAPASAAAEDKPAAPLLPVAAIVTTVLMWASTFVIMRAAAVDISPGPLALIRLFAGSLTLSALVLISRRGRPKMPGPRGLLLTAAFGVIWFAVYTLAFNWAGHFLDAGTVAMVVNLAPLMVGVAAVVVFKEAFPRRLFLGMLVSLSGIGFITAAGSTGQLAVAGLLIGFAAAVLYAAGMMVQKLALQHTDPLTATWLGCTSGLLALLPFLPQTFSELGWTGSGDGISTATLLGAVYMGIGPTALGFWFWGYAMTRFPTGRVASATLTVPAVVVVMSWLTLGEVPPPLAITGGAICLTGVALAQWRPRRRNQLRAGA